MTANPQDEVGYVLETIKGNWPSDEFPDRLARIDRDEPKILETDERTKSLELRHWNGVGASLVERQTEPRGTEYDHYVETVVDIRVEGLHEKEHGQVESRLAFARLVDFIQHALLIDRSYPDVTPDADDIGKVCYRDLRVENETDLSGDDKNYFRTDFDVRLTGVEVLPEL